MTHEVMIQAGSKLQSLIGSTTMGTQIQDYLLVKASLPIRRRNVASPMMLQAISFAQSIMIGMIQSMLFATFSHLINSVTLSSRVRVGAAAPLRATYNISFSVGTISSYRSHSDAASTASHS